MNQVENISKGRGGGGGGYVKVNGKKEAQYTVYVLKISGAWVCACVCLPVCARVCVYVRYNVINDNYSLRNIFQVWR